MNQENRQDINEIPGLKSLLVSMANSQNQFVSDLMAAHALLKEHGLVTDVKFEVKPIPLGDAGELVNSLVVDVQASTQKLNPRSRMEADIQTTMDEIAGQMVAPFVDENLAQVTDNLIGKASPSEAAIAAAVEEGFTSPPKEEIIANVQDFVNKVDVSTIGAKVAAPMTYAGVPRSAPMRQNIVERMKEMGKWETVCPSDAMMEVATQFALESNVQGLMQALHLTRREAIAILDQHPLPANWSELAEQKADQSLAPSVPVDEPLEVFGAPEVPDMSKTTITHYVVPDMPTPIDEEVFAASPTQPLPRVNAVGKYIAPILRLYLSNTLIINGVGGMTFKRFREDLSVIPMDKLLAWPTGIYQNQDTGANQLLLNISGADLQCAVVIPDLYNAAGPRNEEDLRNMVAQASYMLWVQHDKRIRRIDDETPPDVFNASMPVFGKLVETYFRVKPT